MKRKYINLTILAVFAIILIAIVASPKKESAPLTQAQQDSIRVQSLFSEWDGSNVALEEYVKNQMNDPESFEHVETRFAIDSKNKIQVIMKFRGKNKFGGVVTQSAHATQDLEGNLLDVAIN